MKGNLSAVLSKAFAYEGGYVDHPDDPGGATNRGITIGRLAEHRGKPVTKADVKALTVREAEEIYEVGYWKPIRGDDLPLGVDLSACDYAINSGASRSAKDLQRVIGVEPDGVIGRVTLDALADFDAAAVVKAHCARRLAFFKSLAIWNTFGKGWSRRIADVEATALSWLLTKPQLEAEAEKAKDTSKGQLGAAGATGVGGTAIGVEQGANVPVLAIVVAVVLIAAPLIIRAIVHAQRAKALQAVAQEA